MSNPYAKTAWVDGVTHPQASLFGIMEQGIFDAHARPLARVTNSATQSIPNTTSTSITFDTEQVDQDGLGGSTIHSTSSNTSRLVCRVAGFYFIYANVAMATNATGYREIILWVNGASAIADVVVTVVSAVTVERMCVNTIFQLAVSDFVEVQVSQTSGGALATDISGSGWPSFGMSRVA